MTPQTKSKPRTIDRTAIDQMAPTLRDGILLPADAQYEEARHVWNAMIDRRPAAIARVRTNDEVAEAIRFARHQGLEIAVRGGGHSAAGLAVVDDGLVIDLSQMNQVRVDPKRRLALAEGGATWAEFDAATQEHGLATTGGAVSMTGISGLTLGGGVGYLMRKHGLTCDNLLAAEVVLADGSTVLTSESERPELLWGLRGGGGNFGIVTKFAYRLHPLDRIYAGPLLYPRDRALDAFRVYRDQTAQAPDELTTFLTLLRTPDGVPAVEFVPAFAGDTAAGEAAVAPFRSLGEPLADMVEPMPYVALQRMFDDGFAPGMHVYWKSHFLEALPDAAIDTLIASANAAPSPLNAVMVEQLGGAVARVDQNATAFDHRDAAFNLAIIATWSDPAEEEANVAWARELWEAMRPFAHGTYVNYLGVGDAPARVRDAYSPEKYARLAELKLEYDPENLFHRNQNITPA